MSDRSTSADSRRRRPQPSPHRRGGSKVRPRQAHQQSRYPAASAVLARLRRTHLRSRRRRRLPVAPPPPDPLWLGHGGGGGALLPWGARPPSRSAAWRRRVGPAAPIHARARARMHACTHARHTHSVCLPVCLSICRLSLCLYYCLSISPFLLALIVSLARKTSKLEEPQLSKVWRRIPASSA